MNSILTARIDPKFDLEKIMEPGDGGFLTKRPWALTDPLFCCLHNLRCCRQKKVHWENGDYYQDPSQWMI
ncbi:hypothetical protein AAHC03_016802 [Spirometra sp. Aus1]|nr:unnamed protein product [Spirometra erinaceieuropaei]